MVRPFLQNLPGMTSADEPAADDENAANALRPRPVPARHPLPGRCRSPRRPVGEGRAGHPAQSQLERLSIISGTPKTVIPKIRQVLEYIRPGSVCFWDADGAMDHDDAMRSLRLFGSDVLPAVREMGKELELDSPFERDTKTGEAIVQGAGV